MKNRYLAMSAAAIVLMLSLFGSVASAYPINQAGATKATASEDRVKSQEHHRVQIVGRVLEVHKDGLLLMTRRGQVRVRVTDETVIRVADNGTCVDGTLDDIQVGEPARVVGGLLVNRHVVVARGVSQCPPSTDESDN
jgi:hypothetical protein